MVSMYFIYILYTFIFIISLLILFVPTDSEDILKIKREFIEEFVKKMDKRSFLRKFYFNMIFFVILTLLVLNSYIVISVFYLGIFLMNAFLTSIIYGIHKNLEEVK